MSELHFPKRQTDGYENFLGGRFNRERARFEELAENGQSPQILLIGCCDLRVSPELIFDAGPGEMFVVRNVANLVPPYQPNDDFHGTSAAIEFAVLGLRSSTSWSWATRNAAASKPMRNCSSIPTRGPSDRAISSAAGSG